MVDKEDGRASDASGVRGSRLPPNRNSLVVRIDGDSASVPMVSLPEVMNWGQTPTTAQNLGKADNHR